MKPFSPQSIVHTKYLFFTGKGGVGKTSAACATAVTLADAGKKVLLVSTDPASNLQDVFDTDLSSKGKPIPEVPGLTVANLDPIQAAAEYRESVIAPYRGIMPAAVIQNMEEQLSGSCTVEIAAFNEFTHFMTDASIEQLYDHIIFDTAPTGHTLRMLQLPSAWSSFISESTHGASCLGQLAGLEDKKAVYRQAVDALADAALTTLVLVSRPDASPLKEAERASSELAEIGVQNQILILNGLLEAHDDAVSFALYDRQRQAMEAIPERLAKLPCYQIPLRAYNVSGIDNVRALLVRDQTDGESEALINDALPGLSAVIDDLHQSHKKVIFTMGKGGVGKTTMAAAIALGLVQRGAKVHLTTTDPAAHLRFVLKERKCLTMSHIDEQAELKRYQQEVIDKARRTMSADDLAYIEEDLRSPCTQEIAVFRAFADIVERAGEQVVVIDTAPTGHTLLLLESTQSYDHEIRRTKGETPEAVTRLLPRLRGKETEVVIVTLAETTPVYEALRLEDDLKRARIAAKWWVVNASLQRTDSENRLLRAKAASEIQWINRVYEHTGGYVALIPWSAEDLKEDKLLSL